MFCPFQILDRVFKPESWTNEKEKKLEKVENNPEIDFNEALRQVCHSVVSLGNLISSLSFSIASMKVKDKILSRRVLDIRYECLLSSCYPCRPPLPCSTSPWSALPCSCLPGWAPSSPDSSFSMLQPFLLLCFPVSTGRLTIDMMKDIRLLFFRRGLLEKHCGAAVAKLRETMKGKKME